MDHAFGGMSSTELAAILGFDLAMSPERLGDVLDDAADSRDPDQIECALRIGELVGFGSAQVPSLIRLLGLACHERHEDIVSVLQELRDPRAIDALYSAALVTHAYRDYDEVNALARKCTWALADIGTSDALAKLHVLAASDDEMIAGFARKRIARWDAETGRKGPRASSAR